MRNALVFLQVSLSFHLSTW